MSKNRQELERLSEEDAFGRLVQIKSQEERASLLDEICAGNTQLRARLARLLHAHDREDGLVDELESDFLSLPTSPVAPRKIGDCEIKGEIGRGGMGIVYEAHQVSLNRPVAVKVLSAGLVFSPQAIRRFRKEAEAAARLHHTNIVPIFATGSDHHSPYYVMELVPGPSLEQVLQAMRSEKSCSPRETDSVTDNSSSKSCDEHDATRCPDRGYAETKRVAAAVTVSSSLGAGGQYFDNVASLVAEVADGLAHAHHEGIIHRDIKPANLLFSREGRLCITDFGLAKVLSSPGVTLTGELLGSPRYMSPEQIALAQGRLDHRTDIYSLGATLYELLTLQPAFPANRRDQVLAQVLHKEPRAPRQLNSQIPLDLETICRKAMEKAPEERYQNADSMAEDLRRFVRRHVISTRRIGPVGRTWKWCRRNRTVALLTSLLATTILIATCLMLWQQVSRQRELNWRIQAARSTVQTLASNHPWEAVKEAYGATGDYPLHRDDFLKMIEPVTHELKIETDRPGSDVMVRPTSDPSGEWLTLGTTPLVTRLPHDWYHVRFQSESGQSLLVLEEHRVKQAEWNHILPTEREMVAIPDSWHEGDHDACRVTWLLCRQLPSVQAFQMDRHEVTNAEYKEFVDAGGYEDDKDELWRSLLGESWRETVRTFRDRDNRYPGPLTWRDGTFRPGDERMPVVGISWYEAMAYAKWNGKQLPTIFHWLRAADFNGWHDGLEVAKHSNVGRSRATPWATGQSNAKISANRYGVFDLTGNVKEWCLNEDQAGTRYALGGSWRDTKRCLYRPASYSPLERREDVGFRCASYAHRAELATAAPVTWREMPTEPADVRRYRDTWAYAEKAAWNASPRQRCQLGSRQVDRIEFDAVYGDKERITCYVALPNRDRYASPFQVVLVASGVSVESDDTAHLWGNRSNLDWFGTLIEAGRAVVVPTLYNVATNRRVTEYVEYPGPDDYERYKSNVARMGQDISRTVDFIEQDQLLLGEDLLDHTKIAYLGRCPKSMCWLVTDRLANDRERFKAAIFPNVGILNCPQPAEVDQLAYVPSITTPTLFVACEGHFEFQYKETQVPLYELLPLADGITKRLHPVPDAPWIPTEDFDRQVNYGWLNKWLGRPKTVVK